MPTPPPDGFANDPPDGYEPAKSASEPPDGYETRSFPARMGDAMGKGLNAVLDPITRVVKPSLQMVGEQSEMQPFRSATEPLKSLFPGATGHPVKDVAKSLKGTAELLPRLGSTLQLPQMATQQKTMDYLRSKGANKYVALAAGMMAGAVTDPINIAGAIEVGSGVGAFIKSRNALKMDIMKEGVESASKISETLDKGGLESVPHETSQPSNLHEGNISSTLEPGQKGYVPTETTLSEATQHMELPVSTEFYPSGPPKELTNWTNSAIKELEDLNSSKEWAAPTVDAHQDFMKTVRRYVGHQELARFDGTEMTDQFAGYIPDKARRMLITLYSQLGRSPTIEELNTLRKTFGKIKNTGVKSIGESAENLMDQSLSLTPQEKNALMVYNRYFDGMGQNAQKMDILPRLKEIYGGPHVYEPKSDAEMGFIRRVVTGKSRFGLPRTFDNAIEAAENGWVPKTLDSAELISIYHQNISKAASERYLMDTLEKQGLINYEGRGNQIKSFQSSGMKIAGEVFKKTAYSENPEVQKVMARIMEDPVLDYPFIHAVEKLNSFQKLGSLYLQVFHPKALAMEAMGKGFSPAKFQDGLQLIEDNPEYVRTMIRSGLKVNVVADVGQELASNATKEYKGANPVAMARKFNSIYKDWVFTKQMTGYKIWNASVVAKRFYEMGLIKERALELAVEDSNRTFGGLNLGLMHRSPNMQRLFHMMAYAPDWTESRIRQMGAPFGRGIGDVASRESELIASEARRYWTRTIAMATVSHLASVMNPYEKVLSVDMSSESGFKDVKKLAKILQLNPVYFSSKMAAAPRTFVDFIDPRLSVRRKMERFFEQVLPLPVQRGIRALEKENE